MAKSNGSAPATEASAAIEIQRIPTERMQVPIIGTTPLIVHRFSEKAKRQMLDSQQGKKTPKKHRDPAAEFESSFYRFEDGSPGFPVIAFKAATVGAARFYGTGVKMTELRQFLYFTGEFGVDNQALARIEGEAVMREDVVRINNGKGTDLRWRAEFPEWHTTLDVKYVASMLAQESVLALIEAGGMGVGVGEHRIEKRGENGCFAIDLDREVTVVG